MVVTAIAEDLVIDLTLIMAGFDFETVWSDRAVFLVEGVEIPVASLSHIVESKRLAGQTTDNQQPTTQRFRWVTNRPLTQIVTRFSPSSGQESCQKGRKSSVFLRHDS